MSENKLSLKKRELKGKKLASLRAMGLIPSVVYGGKSEPILTESMYNETAKVVKMAGYHSPIDLDIEGKKQMAMIKDVSFDPVKRTLINIEFQAIKANEIVTAEAPIELIGLGESVAEQAKLNILQVMDRAEVKAKPADLPKALEVSVAELATVEDRVVLADVKLPEGVSYADPEIDLNQVVANVYDAAADAAAAEAAEAEEEAVDAADVPAENGDEDAKDTEDVAE